MPNLKDFKTILSVERAKNVKDSWPNYNIVFKEDEGKVTTVAFSPSLKDHNDNPFVPEPGDMIQYQENKRGTLYVSFGYAKKAEEVEKMKRSPVSDGSEPIGGVRNSDTYWKNKTEYDQDIRDPKIERQTYNKEVFQVYTAIIDKSENGIPTKEQMDAADKLILRGVRMGMKAYLLGLETEREMKEGAYTEGEAQSNEESNGDYHKVKVRGSETKPASKPAKKTTTKETKPSKKEEVVDELEEDEVPF